MENLEPAQDQPSLQTDLVEVEEQFSASGMILGAAYRWRGRTGSRRWPC